MAGALSFACTSFLAVLTAGPFMSGPAPAQTNLSSLIRSALAAGRIHCAAVIHCHSFGMRCLPVIVVAIELLPRGCWNDPPCEVTMGMSMRQAFVSSGAELASIRARTELKRMSGKLSYV